MSSRTRAPLMVTFLIGSLLAFYVELASATYAYIGCVTAASVTSGLLGNILSLLAVTSASQCSIDCAQQSYTYSYYESGDAGLSSSCSCSNTGPSATDITPATSATGICNSTTYTATLNTEPSSGQFTFGQCDSSWTLGDTGLTSTVSVPATCFTNCVSYKYMFLTPGTSSYTCLCSNSFSNPTSGNCGTGKAMYYSQPATSSNIKVNSVSQRSISKKRQLQLDMEEKRRKLDPNKDFCPDGFTACRVRGSSDAFECLDTQSDLESCGGCIEYSGEGSISTSEALGTDCSSMPGVALGAVTCISGKCEVSRCKDGWTLVEGTCVETEGETWRKEQAKRHAEQQGRRCQLKKKSSAYRSILIKQAVDKSIVR